MTRFPSSRRYRAAYAIERALVGGAIRLANRIRRELIGWRPHDDALLFSEPPYVGEVEPLTAAFCRCGWRTAVPEGAPWPYCPRCGRHVTPDGWRPAGDDGSRKAYVGVLLEERVAIRFPAHYLRQQERLRKEEEQVMRELYDHVRKEAG